MTDMSFPNLIENEIHETLDETLDWVALNLESLKSDLAESGAILFRGFPIKTAKDFDQFSAAFGYGDFTYEESLSNAVRINLTPRVFTANEAPPNVEIFLHHEMAQTPIYPDRLFFFCHTSADEGGATPLCRSDLLYAELERKYPEVAQQFAELGLKYSTHMPASDDTESGQGRSWKSTLSVAGQSEAEAKLTQLGYSWEWQTDGSLITTTAVLPAVRQLADGSSSFFNQVIAAHKGWKPRADGRPFLTFGNDEEIPTEALDCLVEMSEQFVAPANWQEGDVALIDNHRVMHGRYPYSGERKRQVLVALALGD